MATDALTKIPLQGLCPEELCAKIAGLPLGDARKIVAQVHRGQNISTPSSLIRRSSRKAAMNAGFVPGLEIVSERKSLLDPFVKYALRTTDGLMIEAVRIPLEHPARYSVCVSSQVGCALACAFCATGRMGFLRNLEIWEIVEQVRVVRRALGALAVGTRVHGVVFQGMGEPLANLDRVLGAIRVMHEPAALAIDARAITVCTAGLPAGIRRMAREAPRVRLALSVGSARDEVRRRLMPIARAHSLAEVLDAAAEHAIVTGLSPMWAVTLLAGENDGPADAAALADCVVAFREKTGKNPRLSVIPYNPIGSGSMGDSVGGKADPFARTSGEAEAAFRDVLAARGVFTHRRYSGGADVGAACGQLSASPLSI
ncbi:MAG: 23S rRNA (adenine(2503)-C(2))-methyltransferase RlmN [Polyangiaceae bacterium]|nr:23S rRNA (adenine(2503)-C(2))-methyltransferase RlmN [Polyangiaceae bacterium]